jgi:phage terminase large subunit-like protein
VSEKDLARLKELEEYERLRTEWALMFYRPYPKQVEFHNAGVAKRERALVAGNQLGKTLGAGNEVAIHATGIYPEWWTGKRFSKPVRGWVSGVTGESTRDNPQRILLGPVGAVGSGTIPKSHILKTSAARGVPDAVETALIKHVSGGVSQITFKAYADGREKWQGESLDFVWFDEEPPLDIYTEGLTRTNATKGVVFCTFTPLLGMSDVVMRFWNHRTHPDRGMVLMTIDDVGHYTEEEKRRIIEAYPEHEREARANGVPMLGSGRIYPVAESVVKEPAIEVPPSWPVLVAMDFGWQQHPTAAVKMAWEKEADVVHIVSAYRQSGQPLPVYAAAIKAMGKHPIAWPHDGLIHDKSSGVQIAQIYRNQGCRLVSEHAQFPDERKNGVEAAIQETLLRMQTRRLRVNENLHDWFEEFRLWHYKDGKPVDEREDLMKATHYGLMMLRYARPAEQEEEKPQRYSKPSRYSGATSWSA